MPHLAGLLQFMHAREAAFGDDLFQIHKFDVVALNQIDVIDMKPGETFIDAPDHALCGEIEFAFTILADLGRQQIALARDLPQRPAKDGLRAGGAVVG